MAQGETPGITSTPTVEVEIPPLQRVGYIKSFDIGKIEVKIRIYDEDKEVKTVWINMGRRSLMALVATKIERGASGLWFYKHDELIGYLPLDEVVE